MAKWIELHRSGTTVLLRENSIYSVTRDDIGKVTVWFKDSDSATYDDSYEEVKKMLEVQHETD